MKCSSINTKSDVLSRNNIFRRIQKLKWSTLFFALGPMFLCTATSNAKVPSQQVPFSASTRIPTSPQSEGGWIPLKLYQKLRKAHDRKPQGEAKIGESSFTARYQRKGFRIQGQINIETTGQGWHEIPVLKSKYPLYNAKLQYQEKTAPTTQPAHLQAGYNGWNILSVYGKVRATLHLSFFVPRLSGPDTKAKFFFPKASAIRFKAIFPEKGFRPKLTGGIQTMVKRGKTNTTLSTLLSYQQKGYTLSWWQALQNTETKNPKHKKRSRLYARTFSLLSVGESGQELFFTVRYTIVHAPKDRFQLIIPKGLHIRRVQGLGIRDYRIRKRASLKDGSKVLDVLLRETVPDRYELSILAERKKQYLKAPLTIPQLLGVQRETGYLGVEVIGNVALKIKSKNALNIDVQELPPEITKGTSRPILRAYRYNKRPISWSVQAKRHRNISVPAASIDKASYLQVVNPKGRSWIHATYRVRNTFKQFLAVTLPAKALIRSAFIGGKGVKPARDTKGRILIPLKRSGKSSGDAFTVELIYSLQSKPFKRISQHRYELPKADLWISTLQWRLYLPSGKIYWKGNLQKNSYIRSYLGWNYLKIHSRVSQSRLSIQQHHRSKFSNLQSKGSLPIRLKLPRTGRSHLFMRYHIASNGVTQIKIKHHVPWMRTFGFALFFFSGFLFLAGLRLLQLFKKQHFFSLLLLLLGAFLSVIGTHFSGSFQSKLLFAGMLGGLGIAIVLQFILWMDRRKRQANG